MIILEENFKWHLDAFASQLFVFYCTYPTWNKSSTRVAIFPQFLSKRCNNFSLQCTFVKNIKCI